MIQHVLTLPDGEQIPYQLERRQRRTIGLKVTPDGLIVHAPKRIAESQLHLALLEKSGWIRSKLNAQMQNKVPAAQWVDGEQLLLLGSTITLRVIHGTGHAQPKFAQEILTVAARDTHGQAQIARKVVQWYKKQAMPDFARRLEIFSAKLGVPTPKLMLSNAQSRWGSCNSRGEVRLNWRLIQAPPQLINYVICHELAHLKEMNHSARFWAVVETLYPDYRNAEKQLKQVSPKLRRF